MYPREVEDVILRHPDVAQAAVFGVPDAVHGQEVHAAVVLAPGKSLPGQELLEFVRERVAAYKYPRVVHVRESLPTGASGKLLKRELVAEQATAGNV